MLHCFECGGGTFLEDPTGKMYCGGCGAAAPLSNQLMANTWGEDFTPEQAVVEYRKNNGLFDNYDPMDRRDLIFIDELDFERFM